MTEIEVVETNEERLGGLEDAIKYALKEDVITLEFYQDLSYLLWQAKKVPKLESAVVKLNHTNYLLRQGKIYKEWESDQFRIIAERKQLQDQLDKIKTLVNSDKVAHAVKFDLQMMFKGDAE